MKVLQCQGFEIYEKNTFRKRPETIRIDGAMIGLVDCNEFFERYNAYLDRLNAFLVVKVEL